MEDWLAEDDGTPAIALRARPEWPAEDTVLPIASATVRVVPCPTPLAARAALHERTDAERLVLLTELTDAELGDGLLAHLSRQTVRTVDPWEVAAHLFGAQDVDPTLVRMGRWVANALTDFAPTAGWPATTGTVLTREHALRCLAAELLGIGRDQIDSAGLVQWSTDATAVLRLNKVSAEIIDGLTGFLTEVAGAAARPVLTAARAGHGVDAVPLGLLAGMLWPTPTGGPRATEIAVAQARLEPRFGGVRISDAEATAFSAAAEAWVDRVFGSGDPQDRADGHRMLTRAEAIAAEIDATSLLSASNLLPAGFLQRLRDVATAVRLAVPGPGPADTVAVAEAQAAVNRLAGHRGGDARRMETATMAVRLLRWLSTPDGPPAATLLDALHRHVREDGWVDRARLDVFAGDPDQQVAEAYHLLHRAVDARRSRHDQRFAELLVAATEAEAAPGAMLRVEDVLERVVRPIVDAGRRVLLLVMDGMSVAAATELAESVTRSGAWLELTPDGGPRTGVLAALPTLTEISRCSLFSGRIAVGQQPAEQAGFQARFPGAVLLHKAALRAGAGASFEPDVLAALDNPNQQLVAAVVNTIDDALDRSEPGTAVWGTENILSVRDLLSLAQDRVVVVLSDHGHVIDRGPEADFRPSPEKKNRWRTAEVPTGDGEILVRGSRVAAGGGTVVLPWREEIRYGPRKAGYHGGAAPAEAVIPLLLFSAGEETAVPGWAGAPVAGPAWWREPTTSPEPGSATPPRDAAARADTTTAGKRPRSKPAQTEGLFELPSPAAASPTQAAPHRDPAQSTLADALLASDAYRQRRGTRAPLPDERVAALVGALLAGGGRASLDGLAAGAGIPAHRIVGVITALRKLLQVEGYPVLTIDPDGQTAKLDVPLLIEQFELQP
ncbi:BREX-2 system phosphatase PglZ [Krasilnikovia sp. MM14-A1004]|uniref:BREX-2 system phosphatase PglZ n=1 Tax=Krasilnikovia sp. MM14-A1004 TaxID=3373541 RepID=UPI00399D2940